MKVLMISSDKSLFTEGSALGGRVKAYGSFTEELHVIVLSRRGGAHAAKNISSNVFIYPTRSVSRFLYIRDAIRLGRKIITKSPGEWVIDAQDPFESGLAGLRLSRKTGARLHLQIHTDFLSPYFARHSFLNRLRLFISRRTIPEAHGIRVVSGRIKESLEKRFGKKLKAAPRILPVFTDWRRYAKERQGPTLRDRYPQFNFIMLMVCRLTAEKNLPCALRLLQEVLGQYAKVGLIIVGDGPERGRLEACARSLRVAEHVVFAGWQTDLGLYYRTASVFVQTSFYEGYGLALLEALAANRPAVSSDVGIASDVLHFEGKSFVCPVGDLDCFSKKIRWFIEDNNLALRFGAAGESLAARVGPPEWSDYLKRYEEMLRACLQSGVNG